MENKIEYRIEDGSLIIDNYFNNLKIGSINCGSVENILNKCKLYDGEYETLLKENEYMKHIAKDFDQLQQENKQLKEEIARLKKRNQEIYDGFKAAIDEVCETDREKREYKQKIDKAVEYIKENIYSYYDSKGEKYIEETVFERKANPKELLDILKEVSE